MDTMMVEEKKAKNSRKLQEDRGVVSIVFCDIAEFESLVRDGVLESEGVGVQVERTGHGTLRVRARVGLPSVSFRGLCDLQALAAFPLRAPAVCAFVVEGARRALRDGRASVFMWELFTTKFLVDSGEWRRIGEVPTPWPCFSVAATDAALESSGPELLRVLDGGRRESGEVELLDAPELRDAHLAEQRLHRPLVRTVGELLALDQRVEAGRVQRPFARRGLVGGILAGAEVEDELALGGLLVRD